MDIILIDLSDIKEGVLWEIEQCKRLNQLDSIIFLVDEKESSTASSFLTNNLDNHFFQLFEYYPNGLTDPSGFYNAIKNKTEKVNQTLKLQVNENSKSELGFQSKSTIKDKLFAVLIIFITIGSLYIFNPSLEGFAVYPEKSAIEKRAKSVIADTIFDIESGLIENLFTNRQSKYIGILASRNKVSFLDITTNQILNTSVSDSLKTNSASFFPGSNVLVCGGHWSSDYPVSLWRISEDHIESVLIRHKPWMRTKTLKGINKIDFGFKPEILLLLSDKYCYSLDPKSAFIIDSVESMDAIDMVFREKDSTLITITDEGQILYRKVNAEGSISRQYKARMLYFPNRSKIFIDERGQFLIYRDTNERDLVIWDTYLQEKRFSFDYSGYIGIEDACFIDKDHLATTIGHVTIIHQLLTDRTYKLDHPSSLESMVYCHQNNNLYGVTFSAKMVIWNLDFLFDKTIQEH